MLHVKCAIMKQQSAFKSLSNLYNNWVFERISLKWNVAVGMLLHCVEEILYLFADPDQVNKLINQPPKKMLFLFLLFLVSFFLRLFEIQDSCMTMSWKMRIQMIIDCDFYYLIACVELSIRCWDIYLYSFCFLFIFFQFSVLIHSVWFSFFFLYIYWKKRGNLCVVYVIQTLFFGFTVEGQWQFFPKITF